MILYRAAMAALVPFLTVLTLVQRLGGRVASGALAQRFGRVARPQATRIDGADPGRPAVWLHGASNGELASALGLVRRISAERPGLTVLVTANTGTGVDLARSWGVPGVHAALAPFDTRAATARLLRRWQPALLIVIENELWPARLAAAQSASVPVALVGARMSSRSARRWARLAPGLMRTTLGRLTLVSAQDDASAERLVALGLAEDRLGPVVMLKSAGPSDATMPPAERGHDLPRDRVLLAASTHPGEEALILHAFAAARAQFDLLILAPRHARRGTEVAGVIAAAGLAFARRSEGAAPPPTVDVPVFLADTMGEMALWYRMAGVTIIGGSFVPLGGHTPYEPCGAGSAIVHGPHMENFAAPAAALARAGAAIAVGRTGLMAALAGLDAARQAELATAARLALPPDDGIEGIAARILALLPAAPPNGHKNGASDNA